MFLLKLKPYTRLLLKTCWFRLSYKNIYNYFYHYVAALLSDNICVVDVDKR